MKLIKRIQFNLIKNYILLQKSNKLAFIEKLAAIFIDVVSFKMINSYTKKTILDSLNSFRLKVVYF